jgi:anthranilate synthase component 1
MNPKNSPQISAMARRRLLPISNPVATFAALTDNGQRPHTLMLESAEPSSRRTQKSMLFVSAALSVICRGAQVTLTALNHEGRALLPALTEHFQNYADENNADDTLTLTMPLPKNQKGCSENERLKCPSTLTVLRDLNNLLRRAMPYSEDAIYLTGAFAYDLVDQFENLPDATQDKNHFPDYQFYLADQIILIDHIAKKTEAVTLSFGAATHDELIAKLDNIESTLKSEKHTQEKVITDMRQVNHDRLHVDCDNAQFAAQVAQLKQHIVAGDVFQIVLSRSFYEPCRDAFAAYETLRALNPSPYLFTMNGGDFILFGASPESAVKVDGATRTIEIAPIAGTRRRGLRDDGTVDYDLDARIEADLRLDEKENAEHMMLVDLARNDVARVAKSGTRHVSSLLQTVRYSHVMHLVSRVEGTLRDDLDALHAYQVSMNMGTLTGAPKIRAMQLLREYEPTRRGHYGGTIGYLRGDGNFDTAIVIRAALVKNNVAEIRVGAGVVHDSDPAAEADETFRKAEAVLRALQTAEAGESVHV